MCTASTMASVPASAQQRGQPILAFTSIGELSAQIVLRCSSERGSRVWLVKSKPPKQGARVQGRSSPTMQHQRRMIMLRNVLIGFAAVALIGATFVSNDALARGGRGGGFHAGGFHAAGFRGGAVAGRGGAYRSGAYRGVAYRGGVYHGAAWCGAYPYAGAAVGAAAVGVAAVGAGAARYYGSYGYANGCYRNAAGYMVCPNQY